MNAENPSTAEVGRQVEDLRQEVRSGFKEMRERFDKVPNNETLLALLQGRDAANAAEFRSLREDVGDNRTEIAKVETGARAEISKLEERLAKSRTAVIAVAGVLASSVLGVLALVFSQLGGPA